MKKIVLIAAVLFGITTLQAQVTEPGLAYVKYHIKFANDTNNRAKYFETDIYTVIGKEYSVYTMRLPEPPAPETNLSSGGTVRVTSNVSYAAGAPPIMEPFFYKFPSNELISIGRFGSDFMAIVDQVPTKWNITEETKEIGGYDAQKATIHWKGRDYEVWFTKEIPFATGPWKFVGLPGLVLEVKDKSGDIHIEYAGFDKFDEPRPFTLYYSTPKLVSYTDFVKTRKQFQDNAGSHLDNMLNSNPGAKITIKGKDGQEMSIDEMKAMMKKSAEDGKKRNNNPVEF
ncbi:GLPGLI family protein [Gynurincola endophyticus]|uniref:GLPGLI family protein n=1 Tax=Gynurincola endophyticus TaxID=2479004 RepID=UPI000F8D7811|nr:GLPGLI family protein [Gynurincola endophyticus]